MTEHDGNEGFEAGLRWLAQQVERSVERLEQLDEETARSLGIDVERTRDFVEGAGRWLNDQAENFAGRAEMWSTFMSVAQGRARGRTEGRRESRRGGPHPLDVPTPAQGLALSALDSGRWTVEPGSHVLVTAGEGPAPANATDLVGELRARDWIDADGEVTLVGRSALKRWMDQSTTS